MLVLQKNNVSRKAMLGGSVAAGAALLVPSERVAAAGSGPSATIAAKETLRPNAITFFKDPSFNYNVLGLCGTVAYGAAEFGEVATAVNNINARGADYNAYFDEFYALGQRLRQQGDAALARGHAVSARGAYLRSAMYFAQALFFVLGTRDPSRETAVYRTMRDSWRRAMALFNPPVEHVRIPYAGTWLPGNFFKAAPSNAPRPTVIVNNGSDGQNVEVYAQYGAAALEHGYNVLIFEGPGQGSMVFERRVPFRPDWETVITPVVDFLRARPDVNAAQIALLGVSLGGVLTPRAVAFEHRLAALCTVLMPDGAPPRMKRACGGAILEAVASGRRSGRVWCSEPVHSMTAEP